MKLQRLTLNNFKGLSYVFEPRGLSANIYGQNKSGKTTLADAYSWLMTDKDTLQRSRFEIKTLHEDGSVEHDQEHSVEGLFFCASGNIITFKKVYREERTQKRGRGIPLLTGHSTAYSFNGSQVTREEYHQKIEMTAAGEIWRQLTSPLYFSAELRWEQRRDVLIAICGDISDQEVIENYPELDRYPQILAGFPKEKIKRELKDTITQAEKDLKKVRISLKEAEKRIEVEVSDKQFEEVRNIYDILENNIKTSAEKIYGLTQSNALISKKKELAEAEKDEIVWRSHQRQLQDEILMEKEKEQAEILKAAKEGKKGLREIALEIRNKQDLIKSLETDREILRQNFYVFADRTNKKNQLCPECGQTVTREFLQQKWQLFRSEINNKGKEISETISVLSKEIVEMSKQQEDMNEANALKIADYTSMEAEISRIKQVSSPVSPKHNEKISNIQREINEIEAGQPQEQIETLNSEIDKAKAEQELARKIMEAWGNNLKTRKRIEEILEEQNATALRYENACQDEMLIEKFGRAKMAILQPRFRSKFKTVDFKLIHEPISGETQDVCEVIVGGVPFSTNLNHGDCILAGIEIIAVLSDFYGLSLPLWIDNAEALTQPIPNTEGQQVFCLDAQKDVEGLVITT